MINEPQEEPVRLDDLEDEYGSAQELPAADKARLAIAGWVLGSLGLIFLASCGALLWGPEGRDTQAQAIFDFVKTMAPPIATLVIGFYFRSESA